MGDGSAGVLVERGEGGGGREGEKVRRRERDQVTSFLMASRRGPLGPRDPP